ncbi:MAG TPA: hypothetical protein VGT42_06070 [Gammaproteobacteria bacterium]|nr:hypothetical protein [Gammaproteobacteria bacterium]
MRRIAYLFFAVVPLLAGCATATETVSPDLTATIPSTADAKWTFSAHTRWADPVHISISINGTPLTAVVEVSPGDIIGTYQGHVVRTQCKTEWRKGAAFGSGSCYIYVDGVQTGILLL